MSKRLTVCLLMLGMALLVRRALGQDQDDANTADADGSLALAERFASVAHQKLNDENVKPAMWRQAAVLLEASCRLAPTEGRFPRLLADDYLQIHDVPGALAALKKYRAVNNITSDDQFGQTQQIDLYLSQMTSANQKMDYCHLLMDKQMIPVEVRSYVAYRLAQVMLDRSDNQMAIKTLETVLHLSPLNTAALRLKYDLTQQDDTPLERVGQLLALVRANPADPMVVSRLAQQLADVGLVHDSMGWFNFANMLYARAGIRPDSQFARGAASELALSDRGKDADGLLQEYLGAVPSDSQAWMLDLAVLKYGAEQMKDSPLKDPYEKAKHLAAIALNNNLAEVRRAAGATIATTRPMDSTEQPVAGDYSGDAAMLAKAARPDLLQEYINAATDLAWFNLYIQHDATSADAILPTLAQLLGESDVVVTRLRGLRELVNANTDAATAKLSTVADRDPYAALGMLQIDQNYPSKKDDVAAEARKLLADHPSGVLGAILFEGVRSTGVTVLPTAGSAAIATALSQFPRDFLAITQTPAMFYYIRAEPLKSSYEFDEPVLVRVTIQNIGDYDLTVGPEGIIHSDLWFDAHLRGQAELPVLAAAFDRIGQKLVLGRGQSISKVVRVDTGPLNEVFQANPVMTLTVNMTVCTNPIIQHGDSKQLEAIAGPGGYRVQLARMLQRTAISASTPDERAKLIDRLNSGDGGQKIRAMESMAAVISQAKKGAMANAEINSVIDDFTARIARTQADASAPVRTWAQYLTMVTDSDESKNKDFEAMTTSKDWQTRLLALVLSVNLSDHGAGVCKLLENDPDQAVKDYAKVSQSLVRELAATQPSAGADTAK